MQLHLFFFPSYVHKGVCSHLLWPSSLSSFPNKFLRSTHISDQVWSSSLPCLSAVIDTPGALDLEEDTKKRWTKGTKHHKQQKRVACWGTGCWSPSFFCNRNAKHQFLSINFSQSVHSRVWERLQGSSVPIHTKNFSCCYWQASCLCWLGFQTKGNSLWPSKQQ